MKKVMAILGIIILFLAVGIGFYFLGSKNRRTTEVKPPSAFVEVTPLPSPEPGEPEASASAHTQTIRGGGILTFPKYELTAGSDWKVTRESENVEMEQITLTKDGYELSVLEGGFGGSACLYPGDPDVEGPSARYISYIEITAKSGDVFRRGTTTSGVLGICQKTQYGWEAPTLFGSIGFKTPTPASGDILIEMDKIIASITRI